MSPKSNESASNTKRLDWAKFTDFKSHNTRQDLVKLCSKKSKLDLKDIFSTPDKTGLLPIHWASIHNRFDLLEFMIAHGSPVDARCRNKLFADGTALHLAAMNGSIQATSILLKSRREAKPTPVDENQTKPKTLYDSNITEFEPPRSSQESSSWLAMRDSDGQTPLMRSAPPKSKRLDTIRDLLRKNSWSLGGRPAEMALFLINRGADWRQVDSLHDMNLLHLAIINDYEDIVCLLLELDNEIAHIPARIKPNTEQRPNKPSSKPGEFVTVDLKNSPSPTDTEISSFSIDSNKEPLISRREKGRELLESSGISPLQLAMIYGRVNLVSRLWQFVGDPSREDELRSILSKAFWQNKSEIANLIRKSSMRLFLILDVCLILIFFIPLKDWDGRILLLSFCITLVFVFRVILKNPGYLAENFSEYQEELHKLVGKKETDRQAKKTQKTSDVEERVRLLCHKCRCLRLARSRHCNYCQKCIIEFDHHCIYLSCCIGKYNRLDFLISLILTTITASYGTALYISNAHDEKQTPGFLYRLLYFIGLVSIFKYAIIGFMSSFCMLKRASLGVTMYEEIRSKRIRNIFGRKGPPDNISKTIGAYSIKDSFWRYAPNRFLTGDLGFDKMLHNLKEFCNFTQPQDFLASFFASDTTLFNSLSRARRDSGFIKNTF